MKKGYDLGREPVVGLCFKLALPAMIAQAVSVLYNIVDRLFIANIPVIGDTALAGVGIVGPIITLLSSFGTLVGIGGSIYMAMSLGKGETEKASAILSNSFKALAVLAIVLTVLFFSFKKPLLMVFGANDQTFLYANAYMNIYVLGTFFALMAIGLNSFAICQGFPRKAMATVLIGALLNIGLDYVLIVQFNWGVEGAAIATVVSQMASCLYILQFLFSKKVAFPIQLKGHTWQWSLIRGVVRYGFSPFIILLTDSVIIIAMNASLKHYGGAQATLYITAVTIMQSFLLMVTGPMIGITGGTQALISYNYGAQRRDRIETAIKTIAGMCLGYTTVMFVVSKCLGKLFVMSFTHDAVLIQMATRGISIFMVMIVPLALQYTFVDALTALGKTHIALALSLTRKSLFLGCVVIVPIFFGPFSIFFSEPVADGIAASLSSYVFYRQWHCLAFNRKKS